MDDYPENYLTWFEGIKTIMWSAWNDKTHQTHINKL
jgi:hypothetical protein